jgi:hypothetical protein
MDLRVVSSQWAIGGDAALKPSDVFVDVVSSGAKVHRASGEALEAKADIKLSMDWAETGPRQLAVFARKLVRISRRDGDFEVQQGAIQLVEPLDLPGTPLIAVGTLPESAELADHVGERYLPTRFKLRLRTQAAWERDQSLDLSLETMYLDLKGTGSSNSSSRVVAKQRYWNSSDVSSRLISVCI